MIAPIQRRTPNSVPQSDSRSGACRKRKRRSPSFAGACLGMASVAAMILALPGYSGETPQTAEPSRTRRIATDEAFASDVLPVIQKHCATCHGEDDPEGDVALYDLRSPQQVLENRATWEKVFKQLGIGGMPPKRLRRRPTPDEQKALIQWLDLKLHYVDCDLVDDVGRVTIHRLNRTEYNNTVGDLFGIDVRAADDFPSDDVGYGFNNIGDVLTLPPLLLEKYVDASEQIARAVISTQPSGTQPTTAHKRVVFTRPSEEKTVEQAAREIFRRLLPRALRRPVDDVEVDRFVKLVRLAVEQGDSFERGVGVGLQAMLISPHFLFRIEYDPQPDNPQVRHAISDYELASRLSYFLWSTMPDDELFRHAKQGKLHQSDVLDGQIARMLQSPKAAALIENFASQWLNLGRLAAVKPDPKLFPQFTPELREDMVRETQMFISTLLREDRSLQDFLCADFTFVNQRLATHYGIDGVTGEEFRRVSLRGSQRVGVLTHASILTLTSNPNRTSLVRRGVWIVDNVLGMNLPDPPADIPSLEDGAKESGASSLREQLKIHRENPTCASCHDLLDPLGFGFENFDAIGRWREKSEGAPVDAKGTLPEGESFNGPIELVRILSRREEDFAELVTRKMLTYALGRGLEAPDSCAVDDIVADLKKKDYRFSVLVGGIVHSKPFLMRRGEGAEK